MFPYLAVVQLSLPKGLDCTQRRRNRALAPAPIARRSGHRRKAPIADGRQPWSSIRKLGLTPKFAPCRCIAQRAREKTEHCGSSASSCSRPNWCGQQQLRNSWAGSDGSCHARPRTNPWRIRSEAVARNWNARAGSRTGSCDKQTSRGIPSRFLLLFRREPLGPQAAQQPAIARDRAGVARPLAEGRRVHHAVGAFRGLGPPIQAVWPVSP